MSEGRNAEGKRWLLPVCVTAVVDALVHHSSTHQLSSLLCKCVVNSLPNLSHGLSLLISYFNESSVVRRLLYVCVCLRANVRWLWLTGVLLSLGADD